MLTTRVPQASASTSTLLGRPWTIVSATACAVVEVPDGEHAEPGPVPAGLVEGALQGSAAFRESVGLPEGHPYHYPMMVGYPKPKYARLPERKAPKITWK